MESRSQSKIAKYTQLIVIINLAMLPVAWSQSTEKEMPSAIPFYKQGKYGLCTRGKEVLLPAEYDDIRPLNGELFKVVKKRDKGPSLIGIVNDKGGQVLPVEYAEQQPNTIQWLDDDHLLVFKKRYDGTGCRKEGTLLNVKNKETRDLFYYSIGKFSEGLASYDVCKNDWQHETGYIGENGEIEIKLKYSLSGSFSEGKAFVRKGGERLIIDKQERILGIVPRKIKGSCAPFCQGLAMVNLNPGTHRYTPKLGFVNERGQLVIPTIYDFSTDFFPNERAIVQIDLKYGVIDKEGSLTIPLQFKDIVAISTRLFACIDMDNNTLKLIDLNGKVLDEHAFPKHTKHINYNGNYNGPYFKGDYYAQTPVFVLNTIEGIEKSKTYYLIDSSGAVTETTYRDVVPSNDSLLIVQGKNYKWGLINATGDTVIPFDFEEFSSFSEGYALVKRNGKWGAIDRQGKPRIPFQYNLASVGERSFKNGMFRVIADDKKTEYYIDKNGNEYIFKDNPPVDHQHPLPQETKAEKPLKRSRKDAMLDRAKKMERLQQAMDDTKETGRLNLSGFTLTKLPGKVRDLNHITVLDLSNNQLKRLPRFIQQFEDLKKLDLSNNQLKKLPEALRHLDRLGELNVSNNKSLKLKGSIVANLDSLKTFRYFGKRTHPQYQNYPPHQFDALLLQNIKAHYENHNDQPPSEEKIFSKQYDYSKIFFTHKGHISEFRRDEPGFRRKYTGDVYNIYFNKSVTVGKVIRDQLTGPYRKYNKDGQLLEEGAYKIVKDKVFDIPIGTRGGNNYRGFRFFGATSTYRKSVKVGYWKYYHDNGNLRAEGEYKLEKESKSFRIFGRTVDYTAEKDGKWMYYDRSGMVESTDYLSMGSRVKPTAHRPASLSSVEVEYTKDKITFKGIDGKLEVSLINTDGNVVWTKTIYHNTSIDIHYLARGQYFLSMGQKHGNKLVKKIWK